MAKPKKNTLREQYDGEVVDYLVKIKIELPNGRTIEADFSEDMDIDYDLLENQLCDHPAKFAFWSAVLSEQKYVTSKLERMIAIRRAAICQKNLDTARDAGGKLTKYELDEMVECDKEFIRLNLQLLTEGRKLGKLYGIVDALRMKGEAMRSLAGFKRQELRDTADA